MTPYRTPIRYREARLSLGAVSASSVLRVDATGSSNSPSIEAAAGRKRPFNEISGLDEDKYARNYLGCEGSVSFRRKDRFPRSFCWRILHDRRLLEVCCVDLISEQRVGTASGLVFHITFKDNIRRGGVQLTDAVESDALEVFVLTEGNELYTITLKRDVLTRDTVPAEFDSNTIYKKYTPNAFTFRYPYRLLAISALEILISLHDGGLMQLTRQAHEPGTKWTETFFSEGGWRGTLKGLIPLRRHHTIQFGDVELDPGAAAAMVKSPDGKYIWTVTLDHQLKMWNTQTGELESQMDILQEGNPGSERRRSTYVMTADQGTLLRVMALPEMPGQVRLMNPTSDTKRYALVVHSPKDHQFKFYSVNSTYSAVEGDSVDISDMYPPPIKLIPPVDDLLRTNVWKVEDFFMQTGGTGSKLWLRVRSSDVSKMFQLEFDLQSSGSDLKEQWSSGWSIVDPGDSTSARLRELEDFPDSADSISDLGVSPNERWLHFIFYPGRFSTVSIDTALSIYRRGSDVPPAAGAKERPVNIQSLRERLAFAIVENVTLRRQSDDAPDYYRYQQKVQAQWQTFYSLLTHLHDRRHESIGMGIDEDLHLPWSICADFVAPLRGVSRLEWLYYNKTLSTAVGQIDGAWREKLLSDDNETIISILLTAAGEFRHSLSKTWQESFRNAAIAEAMDVNRDALIISDRLKSLYESTRMGDEVTEDEFSLLTKSMEIIGGMGALETPNFEAVLDALDQDVQSRTQRSGRILFEYGNKLMVEIARETLQRAQSILLDLLMLLAFMANDLESNDLSEGFDATPIHRGIMNRLRHHELLLWLASHERDIPIRHERAATTASSDMAPYATSTSPLKDEDAVEKTAMTLLENIFMIDIDSSIDPVVPMTDELTALAVRWTYGVNLYKDWDGFTCYIMSNLLKHRDTEHAADFAKFLSNMPWPTYLIGRMYLASGDYENAAIYLKSAAGDVAVLKSIDRTDSAHLLSAIERNFFGAGYLKYYEHITALFDKAKAYSYVIEVSSIALKHLDRESALGSASLAELDQRKARHNGLALQRIEDSMDEMKILKTNETRDELLNRFFNACLVCGRIEEAFSSLYRFTNPSFQTANLKALVEVSVKQDAIPDLLDLPWSGDFAAQADAALLKLAKRQLTPNSPSSSSFYHQALYSFRARRGNFREAGEILFEYLEILKYANKIYRDPEDDTLIQAYVLLINTMSCCGSGEEWLLGDPITGISNTGAKRRLVTIDDVRREYDVELDRRSDALKGKFPLVGGEPDDVEML